MDQKKSNFSGFLDGYKAGNLASMSSIFRVRRDEINMYIDSSTHVLGNSDTAESKTVKSDLEILKRTLKSDLESISVLVILGESIKKLIASFKNLAPANQGLIENDIRKIVYNFIDLAKKSEDQEVIDLAIEIGESI